MQKDLDLDERLKYSFNHRMYCSNIGNVTVTYTVPSDEAKKSYPSYRSTNFNVKVENIFVLGKDRLIEYMTDNVEAIHNIEQRASLELEMLIYWDNM